MFRYRLHAPDAVHTAAGGKGDAPRREESVPAATETAANTLAHGRAALEKLLAAYELADGMGTDVYFAQPQVHAMAEGKYLSALAELHRSKLLSRSELVRRASSAIDRLGALNLAGDDRCACWGLGFPYREACADEPYVITTAIVAAGLLDIPLPAAEALATRAVTWLQTSAPRMRITSGAKTIDLHCFSPAIAVLVTNVAAAAQGVLYRAHADMQREAVLHWLKDCYHSPLGWNYTADRPRIDLLHQCYIINALLDLGDSAQASSAAQQMVGLFMSGGGFLDKVSVLPRAEAIAFLGRSAADSCIPLSDDKYVLRHSDPARVWSLGELLVVVARLASCDTADRTFWTVMLRRILSTIPQHLEEHPAVRGDAHGPMVRHTMHLAHGLAAAIASLRAHAPNGRRAE